MAQGFKVADAYIEVHTDDDTRRGRQQIERDTTRWANALGLKIGGILGRTLGMSVARVLTATLTGLFQVSKWLAIAAAVGVALQAVAALVVALGKLVGLAPLVVPAVLSMVSAFAALKIAFSGFGEAVKAGWEGDVEKLAEALKKLHPEAQKVVRALIGLKPQLEAFKQAIQGAFFRDLAREVQNLAIIYLPLLQRHLSAVASIFNEFVASFLRFLTTRSVVQDWQVTFAGLEGILRNVMTALLSVLDGFRHIGVVATPILVELTRGLVGATSRFAEAMRLAREDGSLEQFIREALRVGGQLLDLLGNIFAILSPIFTVLAGEGTGILELMVRLTQQLADLLSTAEAAAAIRALFDALNAIVVALGPGVVALLSGLAKALLAAAPGLVALAQFISVGLVALAPILEMAGGFLSQILRELGPILPILAEALGTIVSILGPALVELAPILTDLFAALATAVGPITSILADLVVGLGPSIVVIVQALADALGALEPAARPVAEALGQLLSALAPLLPVLGQALAVILIALAPVVKELAALLGPVISVLAQAASHALERLLPLVVDLAERAGPVLAALFEALTRVLEPLLPLLIQMADIFVDQLIQFMPQLTEIIDQLVPILTQVIVLFGQYFLQALQAILPHLPQLIGMGLQLAVAYLKLFVALAPLIPLFVQIVLLFQRLFIESGLLETGIGILVVVIGGITGVLWALRAVVEVVVSVVSFFARKAIEVGNTIAAVFSGIWDWINGLLGRLRGVLSGVVNSLYNAGRDVVAGFWNGLSSMGGWLANQVKNFVSNNVIGTFKRALGIGSPSREAAKVARWVPLGMVRGMDSERQSVVDAATRLAMAALPALQVAPPASPAPLGGPQDGRRPDGRGDIYVLADFGDGVRQLVRATITDEPELVAASTDEGRRERGFTYTPRART